MIYINNSTEWVEIPKTYPQNIYKYGLRFVNQTTHKVIALIGEDSSQVDTLYKFNIRNVIDKFEVGQYDYMIMSPDWKETYTSGVLQFGEYKAQVIGYSPTINIIQYNPYISPAPKPKREIDIVENGTYDVENYEIANVNVDSKKPEETGSAEYTENGEYTINPNEGYVFSSVNVKVNTPEPKEEETFLKDYDRNGVYDVTPKAGKVFSKGKVIVNVPSDKKPEETFNKSYTDNGEYDIEPTTGSVFSSGKVIVNVPKQKTEETFDETYTDNGTFNINPTSGNVFSGGVVNVNVPKRKDEQEKTVNIVENGTTSVTPDNDKVLSKVDVIVNVPDPTLEELNVTENGVYTPTEYGYSKVTVEVPKDEFKLPNGTKFQSSTFSSITLGDTTSEITDFSKFFGGDPIASNLETVGEMNTSKGTDFTEMFAWNRNKLTSISGTLDLSNATTTDGMFYNCYILKDFPKLIISDKLTNTRRMFMQTYALTTMPIKTSELGNVTDTELMYGLSGITDELYNVDLPKATQIRAMFGKTNVRALVSVDAPLATASDFMFQDCPELTMMPSLNLPKVENAESMFEGCTKLGSVQLAGQSYDLSSLRKADNMFKNCSMNFVNNFPKLSLTSAVSMFEGIQSDISNYNDGIIKVQDTGDIDFSNIFKDSNVTKFNIGFPTYTYGINANLTSAYENTNVIEVDGTFSYVDNNQDENNFAKINANRMFYNCKSLTQSTFGGISLNNTRDNYSNYYHGISNANSMYYNCSNLSSFSNGQKDYYVIYMGYCEDVTDMFYNCISLDISQIGFLKDVGKGFTSYNRDFDLSYMTGYLVTSELKYFIDAFYDLNLNPQTSATVYFNNAVRNQIEQTTVEEYDNKTISTILQERGWQIQYLSH